MNDDLNRAIDLLSKSILLPRGWHTSESGHNWFTNGIDHVAWFDLPDSDQRLEVSITPDNYPGFYVSVLSKEESTDESLANHINKNLVGWTARKYNIDGVNLDDNDNVIDPEDE